MKRPVAFIVLAGVAALLASIVVYSALKKRDAEVQRAMLTTLEIVVAARDLPLGTKIDPSAVKMARWSRDSVPPGSFTEPSAVLNSFAKSTMVQNEPLVSNKLFMGEKTAGVLPLLIPPGMRAVSVPVDEVSDIAGFVLPHAKVDVLVALSNTGGGSQKAFSKVVLQNVEVLAVAQEIEGKKDEPMVVKVVTVLVTPQEAERLTLASHQGTLRLAMRNFSDDKIVMTSGSDVEGMLRSYSAAPVMVQQRTAGHLAAGGLKPAVEVEIMRDGKSRHSVSFISEAAIGPTSQKNSIAKSAPSKANVSEAATSDGDGVTPRAKSETPSKSGENGVEAGAPAGFAPNAKIVDVP